MPTAVSTVVGTRSKRRPSQQDLPAPPVTVANRTSPDTGPTDR
jgi:hypothetical protein